MFLSDLIGVSTSNFDHTTWPDSGTQVV